MALIRSENLKIWRFHVVTADFGPAGASKIRFFELIYVLEFKKNSDPRKVYYEIL